jgi:hypothetical protein
MELLPTELRARLPALYSKKGSTDRTVHIKFFSPYSTWTWLVTEAQPKAYVRKEDRAHFPRQPAKMSTNPINC